MRNQCNPAEIYARRNAAHFATQPQGGWVTCYVGGCWKPIVAFIDDKPTCRRHEKALREASEAEDRAKTPAAIYAARNKAYRRP